MDVDNPRVCVTIFLENPLLILTIINIDPFFIVPNPLGALVVSEIDLVSAGIGMKPSEVKSLEVCPTSPQDQ